MSAIDPFVAWRCLLHRRKYAATCVDQRTRFRCFESDFIGWSLVQILSRARILRSSIRLGDIVVSGTDEACEHFVPRDQSRNIGIYKYGTRWAGIAGPLDTQSCAIAAGTAAGGSCRPRRSATSIDNIISTRPLVAPFSPPPLPTWICGTSGSLPFSIASASASGPAN